MSYKLAIKAQDNKEFRGKKKKLQTFCSFNGALLVIFILLCSSYCQHGLAQSEIQLSGVAGLPTITNPAAAGRTGSISAVAAFRSQWTGFSGAPSTTVLGIDGEVKFLKNLHGLGATFIQDVAGPFQNINISANYSYLIPLDKGLLGLGARVGVENVAFNASDLNPGVDGMENDYHQTTDEALQGSDDSKSALDIGLGAFFQSEKSYLSFSVLHLNAPEIEMSDGAIIRRKPLMTIGAGRQLSGSGTMSLEPRLFFKTDFASWQLEASGTVEIRKRVALGLGYRLQDAIFFQVGVTFNNGLNVGYAYELGTSELRTYNSGSHEVMAAYTFDLNLEKRKKRYKSVRIL